jgi:hypothetical protein
VNVRVAAALQAALVRCGQDAWFDPSITFVDRVARANGDGTSLLVACAHNESTPGLSGTQFVFCPGGQSFGRQAAAAAAVYAQLAQIPGWPARRGDAVENIYECCAFGGDTCYAELLFMSPDDERQWSRADYPALAGEAIARGLANTYGFTYTPEDDMTPEQDQMLRDTRNALYATDAAKDPNGAPIPDHWAIGYTWSDVHGHLLPGVQQLLDQVAVLKAGAPVDVKALAAALLADPSFVPGIAAAVVKLEGTKLGA